MHKAALSAFSGVLIPMHSINAGFNEGEKWLEVQVFVYFECAQGIVEGIWHIGCTKSRCV